MLPKYIQPVSRSFGSPFSGHLSLCVLSVDIMGEVELSCRAYVKMYLHCCLFPRCSINGLLLSSSTTGGAVCVTDCVPLLHSHLPLAPITQLALTQVGPPADRWSAEFEAFSKFVAGTSCLLG